MSHASFAFHAPVAASSAAAHGVSVWRRMWDSMIAVQQARADAYVADVLSQWTPEESCGGERPHGGPRAPRG